MDKSALPHPVLFYSGEFTEWLGLEMCFLCVCSLGLRMDSALSCCSVLFILSFIWNFQRPSGLVGSFLNLLICCEADVMVWTFTLTYANY